MRPVYGVFSHWPKSRPLSLEIAGFFKNETPRLQRFFKTSGLLGKENQAGNADV